MIGHGNFQHLFLGIEIVPQNPKRRLAGRCAEDLGDVVGQCNRLNRLLDLCAVLVEKLLDERDDERFGMLARLCDDFAVGRVNEDFSADNGRVVSFTAGTNIHEAQECRTDRTVDGKRQTLVRRDEIDVGHTSTVVVAEFV